jgi:hypothetical protein
MSGGTKKTSSTMAELGADITLLWIARRHTYINKVCLFFAVIAATET